MHLSEYPDLTLVKRVAKSHPAEWEPGEKAGPDFQSGDLPDLSTAHPPGLRLGLWAESLWIHMELPHGCAQSPLE